MFPRRQFLRSCLGLFGVTLPVAATAATPPAKKFWMVFLDQDGQPIFDGRHVPVTVTRKKHCWLFKATIAIRKPCRFVGMTLMDEKGHIRTRKFVEGPVSCIPGDKFTARYAFDIENDWMAQASLDQYIEITRRPDQQREKQEGRGVPCAI